VEGILKISTAIELAIAFLIFFTLPLASLADQSTEMAAIAAAENFLQRVDASRYAESWDATSGFFKQQVSKQQWVKRLERLRPTFGSLISREIKDQTYAKSLPGAPDGDYLVSQFSTSFTNKKSAALTPLYPNTLNGWIAGRKMRSCDSASGLRRGRREKF